MLVTLRAALSNVFKHLIARTTDIAVNEMKLLFLRQYTLHFIQFIRIWYNELFNLLGYDTTYKVFGYSYNV